MSTSSVTQPSRGAVRACWRIPSSTPHDTPFEQVRRAYERRGSWEGPPDTVTLPAGVSEHLRAPPHDAVASESCQMPPCSIPGGSRRFARRDVG